MNSKAQIGDRIKNIRQMKEIELSVLSERCQIEEILLKKIENNEYTPSLGPLIRIARALGVRLGTFLDDHEELGPIVTRNSDQRAGASFSNLQSNARSHLDFFALASDKSGRHMEPFLIDIVPTTKESHILSSHEGEEFLFVLEGEVELSYGKETVKLLKGDTVYYDSIVEHNVHSANNEPAKVLGVVYAPF